MRSSSGRFNPYESHQVASEATILPSGVVVPIIDGNVAHDSTNLIRGSGDFTIVDDGSLNLVPTDPTDVLAPYGNEVRVRRGIRYPDGEAELITCGVLRIEGSTISGSEGDTSIRVSAMDRAQKISDAKFEEPFTIEDDTNIVEAIESVLDLVDPGFETRFPVTEFTTPKVTAAEGEDPWEFLTKFAKAFGAELYFDYEGVLVAAPVPIAGASPNAGLHEDVNMLDIEVDWSREEAYNRVIATGSNATGGAIHGPNNDSATPRGIATDDDTSSPTYYYGEGPYSFGKKPLFYESEYIRNDDQAETAAEAELQLQMGVGRKISAQAVVDPRLEPGDVLEVTRARVGVVQELHIVDSVRFPLGASDGMDLTTRLSRFLGS